MGFGVKAWVGDCEGPRPPGPSLGVTFLWLGPVFVVTFHPPSWHWQLPAFAFGDACWRPACAEGVPASFG